MQPIPDLAKIMQLAQSPAGRQLIAMLQQRGGSELQDAIAMASAGNYTQARQTISALLANDQAQSLLKQLEETS